MFFGNSESLFEKGGFNPILYPSLDLQFFIVLILMVIAIGILASIYPALKVASKSGRSDQK
jgi:ABC-type lipoprotein release transport system permease subunit